jgi:hypothetical protein
MYHYRVSTVQSTPLVFGRAHERVDVHFFPPKPKKSETILMATYKDSNHGKMLMAFPFEMAKIKKKETPSVLFNL